MVSAALRFACEALRFGLWLSGLNLIMQNLLVGNALLIDLLFSDQLLQLVPQQCRSLRRRICAVTKFVHRQDVGVLGCVQDIVQVL